jgi:AraC-like DNA-binding protein
MEQKISWDSWNRNDRGSLILYEAGWSGEQKPLSFERGEIGCYRLVYVISGSGSYQSPNCSVHLRAGSIFLVYPDTQVSYRPSRTSPWTCAWVACFGAELAEMFQDAGFTSDTPYRRNFSRGEQVQEHMLALCRSKGHTASCYVNAVGEFYRILALLMEQREEEKVAHNPKEVVWQGMEYVQAHYTQTTITVVDVAKAVGVSQSRLYRSFQSVLGKSAKDYLTECRVEKACELLRDTDLSIRVIANAVGFDTPHCFSVMFIRQQGVSPREFRRICQTKEDTFQD